MLRFAFILLVIVGGVFGVSCPSEGQFWFPHPTRCSKFIECNDGVSQEQDCFGDLVFNPEVGYCDFPANYECEDKTEADGKCPPTNSMNEYFLGDTHSCEAYYLCYNGEPIPMTCPDGLHFNRNHWVCDLPEQAGCTLEE